MAWERNKNVPLPSVWREFVSKTNRKYWIQDITEEYKDIIASYMAYGFSKDEPLCKFSHATTYAEYLKLAYNFWRKCVDQNMGLICFTKDEDGDWKIAGMNCTVVSTIDEEYEKFENKCLNKIISTITYVTKQVDAFETLKIDKYLSALGLFVLPEFRGEGIGLELLKAREPLCKACGIKVSCTVFTSLFSQVIATKAGFKDLYDISYSELEKRNPLFKFPGIQDHTTNIKFMYIKYE
nr:uncharacterized protein LOC111428056 isoform X1 [Onthophagus taurus]